MNIRPISVNQLATNAVTSDNAPSQTASQTDSTPEPAQENASLQKDTRQPKPGVEELKKAVDLTNKFVSSINNSLQFSIDKDTDQVIVKVIDKATKEVIKQIPSEEMVALAKALNKLQGLLVEQKA